MTNPYRKQAKALRDIIWALDVGCDLEPDDLETLQFAAKTFETLANGWEQIEEDNPTTFDHLAEEEVSNRPLFEHNLHCFRCGDRMFETGRVIEHYDGTCDVTYGCACGHSEVHTEESEEPPIESEEWE